MPDKDKNGSRDYLPQWDASHHPASLGEQFDDGSVQCHLSPRHCKMKQGRAGFCGVRKNLDGKLVTLNYGRATHVTQESIETEAVFHYAPGSKILSLGNIGCMMNCAYCHNWKTSQARLLDPKDVHIYTPNQVVDIALERRIPVISWTYNDPVVWHEFVIDTSRLARRHGLTNLYKSAFYISAEGAAELCEVIDIFSISIKSMDPDFYKRITTGRLQPVLDATKFVFEQGKHVEISMLMVTDANDRPEDARRLAEWVLENLSDTTPVHFVRFHPDYKYNHVGRTPIDRLNAAREAAMEAGIRYCYLGNVYDSDFVHTYCQDCGSRLIERYGLNAQPVGLDEKGCCQNCRRALDFVSWEKGIRADFKAGKDLFARLDLDRALRQEFLWRGDIKSLHIEAHNETGSPGLVQCRRLNGDAPLMKSEDIPVGPRDSFRFILSKSHPEERGVEVFSPEGFHVRLFEVYDRAHYPTVELQQARSDSDAVPLPRWEGPTVRALRS